MMFEAAWIKGVAVGVALIGAGVGVTYMNGGFCGAACEKSGTEAAALVNVAETSADACALACSDKGEMTTVAATTEACSMAAEACEKVCETACTEKAEACDKPCDEAKDCSAPAVVEVSTEAEAKGCCPGKDAAKTIATDAPAATPAG